MQQPTPQELAMQMLMRDPYRATPEQLSAFLRGLRAVINQWTALHLVCLHCDSNALTNLHRDLVEWITEDGEVYADDLEVYFEEFFQSTRSVQIEDDSMKEVSVVLHNMYCRCCQNDFSMVEQFVQSEELYRRQNPVAMSVGAGCEDENWTAAPANLDQLMAADAGAEVEGEEDEGEAENEEEERPAPQPRKRQNRKNATVKSAGGWSTVL